MSKLTREARDLIEAASAGEGPPRHARDRVRARVLAKVGAGAAIGSATVLGASSTAAKTAVSAALMAKIAAIASVVGVVAVVVVETGIVPRASRAEAVARVAPAPSVTTGAASDPVELTPKAPPVEAPAVAVAEPAATALPTATPRAAAAPVPAPVAARAPVAPAASSPASGTASAAPSLDSETALLARAQAELRAGHPDQALRALDENEATFKGGVLHEERRAERILALCAAGRTDEAKAEARRFLADSPRSPMAARVQSSCAGADAP